MTNEERTRMTMAAAHIGLIAIAAFFVGFHVKWLRTRA